MSPRPLADYCKLRRPNRRAGKANATKKPLAIFCALGGNLLGARRGGDKCLVKPALIPLVKRTRRCCCCRSSGFSAPARLPTSLPKKPPPDWPAFRRSRDASPLDRAGVRDEEADPTLATIREIPGAGAQGSARRSDLHGPPSCDETDTLPSPPPRDLTSRRPSSGNGCGRGYGTGPAASRGCVFESQVEPLPSSRERHSAFAGGSIKG
ncbi:hypothetical protein AAFF_G00058780 [Aldrovandia affinis]|uniref:Uncharacterized protein n=1 Tax=Aldrovandia affinis TaxID=143900 RepID=A0AAD7WF51_9TELE|nr:hypothetical protein AAFF_G00058780 [Aldrovandia affinis]